MQAPQAITAQKRKNKREKFYMYIDLTQHMEHAGYKKHKKEKNEEKNSIFTTVKNYEPVRKRWHRRACAKNLKNIKYTNKYPWAGINAHIMQIIIQTQTHAHTRTHNLPLCGNERTLYNQRL